MFRYYLLFLLFSVILVKYSVYGVGSYDCNRLVNVGMVIFNI